MKKADNKTFSEKLGAFTDFVKNAKFLVVTLIILVVLGIALLSGDGRNIIQSLYENIIGKKYETYTPIQDYSNETYLILKDKLSRDTTIKIENTQITIFEESDISHKYRVEFKDEIYFYHVKKKPDGPWQINKE